LGLQGNERTYPLACGPGYESDSLTGIVFGIASENDDGDVEKPSVFSSANENETSNACDAKSRRNA
jgi:hypothetical protein